MSKIVRTKTQALGGITTDEKRRMDEHAKLWIARAMRTAPIEPDKITPAIEGLYSAAGLKRPRVIVVPSPLVMAFAYGAAAAIWHERKSGKRAGATDRATANATRDATADATADATRNATANATRDATYNATYNATANATRDATYNATRDAEEQAAIACLNMAGQFGLSCAQLWPNVYQDGNMWASYDCYLTACRDILGLELREHEAYAFWEQAAIHGGFRVMHEEFCMVSDFPERLLVDEQNLPHCETGPSHRWRDGWSLYHWHGVRVPAHWIEQRDRLDPAEVLKSQNVEQRAAGISIVGPAQMLDHLPHKIIDSHVDPQCGDLIEVSLPGLPESELYLKFECPRNGLMMEAVNKRELEKIDLHHAHAWHANVPARIYSYPNQRS